MAFLCGRVVDAPGNGEEKREGGRRKGEDPQCQKCVDARRQGLVTHPWQQ